MRILEVSLQRFHAKRYFYSSRSDYCCLHSVLANVNVFLKDFKAIIRVMYVYIQPPVAIKLSM